MGFRKPLDVSALVASIESAMSRTATVQPYQEPSPPDYPYPVGHGAATLSTSLELETWPSVVWDVNSYYLELGVGFRASRKQLLRAYNEREGQSDDRLTYIFSQLLDGDVRRFYDAVPLGNVFLDRYVMERLKEQAIAEARALRERGIETTAEDVLAEMGFKIEKDLDDVDIPKEAGDDVPTEPTDEGLADPWPYLYYLHRVRRWRNDAPQIMRAWQTALMAECHRQRIATSFAVGLMTSERPVEVLSVRGVRVAFISLGMINEFGKIRNIESLAALTSRLL